jgi:hypothetical protein
MQAFKITDLSQTNLDARQNPIKQVNVKLISYCLSPSPFLTCFINTSESTQNNSEGGAYHIRLFNNQKQRIYCYDLNREHHAFETNFLDQLQTETEAKIWQLLLKHGDFIVDCSQQPLDTQTDQLSIQYLSIEQLQFLNTEAVKHLNAIGVGLVPSLYHWLIEPKSPLSRKLRQEALQNFTPILLFKMSPSEAMILDNPHHEANRSTTIDLGLLSINHAIDSGVLLVPMIASAFNFSESDVVSLCKTPYVNLSFEEKIMLKLDVIEKFQGK